MRIAVLSNVVPSAEAIGGAGRIAFLYNEQLTAMGHEIRVFGPREDFARLGQTDVLTRLAFHARDLVSDEVKAQEILDWEPDVLLTHNLTGCGFKTPRIVADCAVRWVHVLHDVQLIEPSGQVIAGESMHALRVAWRWCWSMLRMAMMREPDAVVSPTEWLLAFHQSFGWFEKTPTRVIPNPMPAEEIGVTDRDKEAKKILFVGRVDADKGIRVLIDAMKDVTQGELTVIGDGSFVEPLRAMAPSRVTLIGKQTPEQVRAAMRKHAVVVVPSLVMENQPTVILEALAAGCRIVATDVGGVSETLGAAGWMVAPGNAKKLAEAINEAMASTDTRSRAAQEILARHNPVVCANALSEVLTRG